LDEEEEMDVEERQERVCCVLKNKKLPEGGGKRIEVDKRETR